MRSVLLSSVVITALSLASAAPATADAQAAAVTGARVRVATISTSRGAQGRLLQITAESVFVAGEGVSPANAFNRNDVRTFEVSRGRSSRLKGALLWALPGIALGAVGGVGSVFGYSCESGITHQQCVDASNRVVKDAAVSGAISGALIGGLVGFLRGRERWTSIPIPAP